MIAGCGLGRYKTIIIITIVIRPYLGAGAKAEGQSCPGISCCCWSRCCGGCQPSEAYGTFRSCSKWLTPRGGPCCLSDSPGPCTERDIYSYIYVYVIAFIGSASRMILLDCFPASWYLLGAGCIVNDSNRSGC